VRGRPCMITRRTEFELLTHGRGALLGVPVASAPTTQAQQRGDVRKLLCRGHRIKSPGEAGTISSALNRSSTTGSTRWYGQQVPVSLQIGGEPPTVFLSLRSSSI